MLDQIYGKSQMVAAVIRAGSRRSKADLQAKPSQKKHPLSPA